MQCNIDSKGKAVRLIGGIVTLLIALTLFALGAAGVLVGVWVWIVAAATFVGGAFQVFEARTGWCVVRAMGFKTPI